MGVIYRAHDPAIDRPVAIKLVRADLMGEDDRAEYVERFQREAKAAGRCTHPNIVAVFDFALHEQNPYLVMELVDGITLGQLIKERGRVAPDDAMGIVGQVLDGLAAAHAQGIVHRDIKPANIMVTRDGRVKVADFGISRLDSTGSTQAGAIIGTPSYMAPEQCRGDPVDARTDVFSTGVVLFELLSGRRPFPGTTPHEIWYKLLNQEPQDLATLCPGLPSELMETIGRSLAKAPDARFGGAAEMATALRSSTGTRVGAPGSENTIVMREPARSAMFDRALTDTLIKCLTPHVGPIAQRLVQSAVATGSDLDSVYAKLADSIAAPEDRARFLVEASGAGRGTGAPPAASSASLASALPKEAQERVTRALAAYLGPLATVLVRRQVAGCRDAAELARRVAGHIEQPGERAAFLATIGA